MLTVEPHDIENVLLGGFCRGSANSSRLARFVVRQTGLLFLGRHVDQAGLS